MKRSTMKSNIALQSRCRPEGRLFPRRKVASKTSLLNGVGDFDMELSLAIKESLKYAQQERGDDLRENGLYVSNGPSQNENNHDSSSALGSSAELSRTFYKAVNSKSLTAAGAMAASASDLVSEEVGRLKDLILSQAELIQCQQDEISKKDKEIKAIRSANDALQCRLEQMERQMSSLKHKEESPDAQGTLSEDNAMKSVIPSHSTLTKGPNDMLKVEYRKRRRHTFRFIQKKSPKKQRLLQLHETKGSCSQKELGESEDGDEEEDNSTNSDSEEDEEDSEDNSKDSGTQKEEADKSNKGKSGSEHEEKTIDYQIMQTETLYHLYYPKHACPSPDTKRIQEQSEVETPSWRLKPMTNMYQLEGTENITDEAYNKRHQKFEMEEKRRKRWDLQRLRELRLLEKLQRQREDEIRASQDEADVETFLPSVHDLKHIEITESIPVMAFGQPVPYVSPAEFEIPWEITSSGPMATKNRQRTISVHSKKH
ncbi:unnamed protein product [Lymnaea stagnalis]|uniref:PEHE domain-containing protein n=1 Tax=Lymnaea stagnalis TaxID=6523 RepID=A0AAV2HP63_LYMST